MAIQPLWADCVGSDLRDGFSAQDTASLRARLTDVPFTDGNHWRARRGDTVLHVIGTVHIDDPRLDPVMERLSPIIDSAARVLVEATPAEEEKLQAAMLAQPDLVFLTKGPTLIDLMPAAEWDKLANAATERGIAPFMAAKFQPWYLSLALAMPRCVMMELQSGARGLDKRIIARANAAQVPVEALEPYDTLFRLMARDPIEEQIKFLRYGVLPDDKATDGVTTLLASYFEEKPAEVFEVARITAKAFIDAPDAEIDAAIDKTQDVLLTERNQGWMSRILAAPEGVTVVAVGAAHLPGQQGILQLLQDAGFELERQAF